MSLLYTKGDKIFIKREGTIEMPNRSHFAARRKRNLTVPLLALFLLIGFAAGLAVPRLGSSAPAVSAADGTASGKPDSSASSPDASPQSILPRTMPQQPLTSPAQSWKSPSHRLKRWTS